MLLIITDELFVKLPCLLSLCSYDSLEDMKVGKVSEIPTKLSENNMPFLHFTSIFEVASY